jgi:hypothetical protein
MESELSRARNQIENLSRLLPICSICKKIRDDKGQWHQVEAYIQLTFNTPLGAKRTN